MSSDDVHHEEGSGLFTRAVVAVWFVSRRASLLAASLVKRMLLTGFPITAKWEEDAIRPTARLPTPPIWFRPTAWPPFTVFRDARRRRRPQSELRVVTPARGAAPIVMPTSASLPSTRAQTDEYRDDEGQLDATER